MKTAFALSLALLACGAAQAQLLGPKGAKGTLTVAYEYSAAGKNGDKYEPLEWRVQRTLNMVAEMSAEASQALSMMRPMDAAQTASTEKKRAQVASLHKKMEPTMNDMMKIAERCGEDEACVEKAIVEYGNQMNVDEIHSTKAEVAAVSKQDGPRYQTWRATSEKGTYSIDETYRSKTSDPLCSGKPKNQCSREEIRTGSGEMPVPASAREATTAQLEFDSVNKDIYLKLPVPLAALGYRKQVASDFPDEKSGTSSASLDGFPGKLPAITAVVPGDAKNVSGMQTMKLAGGGAEGGTLTIKWQFVRR